MERKNGYVDLYSILGIPDNEGLNILRLRLDFKNWADTHRTMYMSSLCKYLGSRKDVEVTKVIGADSLVFKFTYRDGNVYYFNYDSDCTPYGELIYGCICDDLGIPHIDYDIARIGALEGTLSKNYKKKDEKHISGETLLRENGNIDLEFSAYDRKMAEIYGKEAVLNGKTKPYHSLEHIWYSLKNRYVEKPDLAQKLMEDIVNMFIVDLITGQTDRHSENWEIIEDGDNTRLRPIFDSRRIFSRLPYTAEIAMSVNSHPKDDVKKLEDNVKAFIKQSRSEYVEKLKNSLWVLSPENFEKIIERIEEKTGVPFPEKLRYEFEDKFETQLDFFLEVLGMEQVEPGKHVLTMMPHT